MGGIYRGRGEGCRFANTLLKDGEKYPILLIEPPGTLEHLPFKTVDD